MLFTMIRRNIGTEMTLFVFFFCIVVDRMIITSTAALLFGTTGYLIAFAYTSLALAFFIVSDPFLYLVQLTPSSVNQSPSQKIMGGCDFLRNI